MAIDLGRAGECAAAAFVKSLGWTLVDQNWRCELGELDLVAIDPSTLPYPTTVAIEVKTRSGLGFGDPLEAITATKLRRLKHLAVRWRQTHLQSPSALRIDAIGVLKRPGYSPIIDHRKGIS